MTAQHNQDDWLRLHHMRDYAHDVIAFTQNTTESDLESDVLLHHGLSYAIGIIGEAASRISTPFRESHPDISWRQIVGMRNFLFHDYAGVNNAILWNTAIIEVPKLLKQLNTLLSDEDE